MGLSLPSALSHGSRHVPRSEGVVRSAAATFAGVIALALIAPATAEAQAVESASAMPAMDHGAMDHSKMDHGNMDHGTSAPPDARDPDAYADGLDHGPMQGMDMADDEVHAQLLFDKLEAFRSRHGEHGQAFEAQAWVGTDLNKLWLKSEGERVGGRLGATRTEALFDRAVAPYWSLQAGVRQDSGEGPGRTWAAFGVQGLAPYGFDVEATAYVGNAGRTALRLQTRYELLLAQRWVLEPEVEVNVYGRSDPERGIGSGVSSIEAGLRLHYEITRKVAPYVGIAWSGKFGGTASMARAAGHAPRETRIVAGIRFWL
ncbi:MAG: copper resistance protein B [Gammaproteobacteria bacterium]|nr:copper resistance protein B [Gammaproteobacteria bacterium]MBU1442278.1 copper resistance protein B [Gammaproteobacteria bacterium]